MLSRDGSFYFENTSAPRHLQPYSNLEYVDKKNIIRLSLVALTQDKISLPLAISMISIFGFNDVEFESMVHCQPHQHDKSSASFAVESPSHTEKSSQELGSDHCDGLGSAIPVASQIEVDEDDQISIQSLYSGGQESEVSEKDEEPTELEDEDEVEENESQTEEEEEEEKEEEKEEDDASPTESESEENEEKGEDKIEFGMLDPLTGYCLIQTAWPSSTSSLIRPQKPVVYIYECRCLKTMDKRLVLVGIDEYQLVCWLPISFHALNQHRYQFITLKTENVLASQLEQLIKFDNVERQKRYLVALQERVQEPILIPSQLTHIYRDLQRYDQQLVQLTSDDNEDDDDDDDEMKEMEIKDSDDDDDIITTIWVAESDGTVLGGMTPHLYPIRFLQTGIVKQHVYDNDQLVVLVWVPVELESWVKSSNVFGAPQARVWNRIPLSYHDSRFVWTRAASS
jgi:hypothetical protein